MEFIQSIDWMQLLRCFVTGGGICIIGQILLDKTKLTPARILVIFVTVGAILGGLAHYNVYKSNIVPLHNLRFLPTWLRLHLFVFETNKMQKKK